MEARSLKPASNTSFQDSQASVSKPTDTLHPFGKSRRHQLPRCLSQKPNCFTRRRNSGPAWTKKKNNNQLIQESSLFSFEALETSSKEVDCHHFHPLEVMIQTFRRGTYGKPFTSTATRHLLQRRKAAHVLHSFPCLMNLKQEAGWGISTHFRGHVGLHHMN